MSKFLSAAVQFAREEDAPTMMEYGLLMVFIALLVVGTFHSFSGFCINAFQDTTAAVSGS